MMMNNILAFFDGACGPENPGGHGGWGAIIRPSIGVSAVVQLTGYCGKRPDMSNNVAEYSGFKGVLDYLLDRSWQNIPIHILGDSTLVVCQMSKTIYGDLRKVCYPKGCGHKSKGGLKSCYNGIKNSGCDCKIDPRPWSIGVGAYSGIAWECQDLLKHFSQTQVIWIPRERNTWADELAQKAIDNRHAT